LSLNRYAKRRDANEPEIVDALEAAGCTVERLDTPADLLVGKGARNFLIEVKAPGGRPTKSQKEFFARWKGQARIVETAEEALEVVRECYTGIDADNTD
jgi:hypothetical protein